MLSCIYRATNTVTNKVYIGFTTDFESRLRRHKTLYKTTNTKFYSSIRKHGWESFVWDIIYVSLDEIHCHQIMEHAFIIQYDSINNGYNTTEGGSGVIGAVRNRIWVNNGSKHRRVPENDIPDGWVVGRINLSRSVKMSDESKQSISKANKIHALKKYKCPYCEVEANKGNLATHIRFKHPNVSSDLYCTSE